MRLAPLYFALRAADALGATWPRNSNVTRFDRVPWQPGLTIVIPDRDGGQMLVEALSSALIALERVDEPHQVVVIANGAPEATYAGLHDSFPTVEFVHIAEPLGFGAAIAHGLARVRHDWVYLMNNDMTLDREALIEVASRRDGAVFSVSSQIFQRSADGRREETGFTDWYINRDGAHVFHAPIGDDSRVRTHLAGSGGATLFRTVPLSRYVEQSRCYDPFYWEDVEWGIRGRRDGYTVLLCPESHAFHRHRATAARFYTATEIDRIVARNRLLFDARNRATPFDIAWLMNRVCDQPYETQRELAAKHVAAETFRARLAAHHASSIARAPVLSDPCRAAVALAPASFSYRLRPFSQNNARHRPRLLVVTPFAVYPPRHGGARRIAGLLAHLRHEFDIILVSDEASLYDGRSFAGFDELCAVHLVWRIERADADADTATPLERRIRTHCHPAIAETVQHALDRYRPALVQIEYAELAELIRLRTDNERWVLGLHDAVTPDDFASPTEARRFENETLDRYDAITVCSVEDHKILKHRHVHCIPNGSSIELGAYRPSDSSQLLFMGPFRYAPNLEGIRRFLRDAFPVVKEAIPEAQIVVLGGDHAKTKIRGEPAFAQRGVEVFDHRDDVRALLDASVLTINPVSGIRGSSIKLIESLTAGRVCVSTIDGARGFREGAFAGLVLADDVATMTKPIIELLRDSSLRHRIEVPDASRLARYQWTHSAQLQRALYDQLLGTQNGS
jgi:GT2 family glycosyltransferase